MIHKTLSPSTVLSLTFLVSTANASDLETKVQTPVTGKVIVKIDSNSISSTANSTAKPAEPIVVDRKSFNSSQVRKIEYGVFPDMKLNLGVLDRKLSEARYETVSATRPRANLNRPAKSKLGLGISRKF